MIVIASFLGSGNTLLRNILYEVYGIESSTYLINPNQIQDENFSKYPLWRCICSHELLLLLKKLHISISLEMEEMRFVQ
jgi:hypothetical protein